jgi:hypothetical protein
MAGDVGCDRRLQVAAPSALLTVATKKGFDESVTSSRQRRQRRPVQWRWWYDRLVETLEALLVARPSTTS